MNFKRHDVQEYIEYDLGCLDLNNWKSYLPSLLVFTVDSSKKIKLENCIESDIQSYFFKSIYSFVQALSNIQRNNYNWSIVQLYYACFYAIRADVLLSNHCLVRCNGLYMTENQIGEKFQSVRFGNTRGDHQMAIALLKKLKNDHKITDEILDVELEGTDAYSWLMKHRERSNYQTKDFTDPRADELFIHVDNYFQTNTVYELLDFYNNEDYNICFDIDHAAISIPYKKIMQIRNKILAKGYSTSDSIRHYPYLKKTLLELGLTKQNIKDLL